MSRRKRLIKAIPTEYACVRFRSRLEAQWARLFDLLEWVWTYEPDLQAGFVIPDFLLAFARPVVLECKPACTVEEVGEARRNLIAKMPQWLADDVLRELRVLSSDPESEPELLAQTLEDLDRVEEGQNPLGHSRRILVGGPQLFVEGERCTLDGDYGFTLCTHEERKHIGIALELGAMCLSCGSPSTAWVPPDVMLGAWREAGSAGQWRPKSKSRSRR